MAALRASTLAALNGKNGFWKHGGVTGVLMVALLGRELDRLICGYQPPKRQLRCQALLAHHVLGRALAAAEEVLAMGDQTMAPKPMAGHGRDTDSPREGDPGPSTATMTPDQRPRPSHPLHAHIGTGKDWEGRPLLEDDPFHSPPSCQATSRKRLFRSARSTAEAAFPMASKSGLDPLCAHQSQP